MLNNVFMDRKIRRNVDVKHFGERGKIENVLVVGNQENQEERYV